MHTGRAALALALGLALTTAGFSRGETVTLVQGRAGYEDGASTFISTFDPEDNLSQVPTLRIRSTDARKALLRWGGLERRPELHGGRFIVEAATLRLYVTTCRNPEGSDITVHQVLTDWDAATATWHERRKGELWAGPGMRAGKDFAPEPAGKLRGPEAGFTGWIEIPLRAVVVQEWLALPGAAWQPEANHGLVIKTECPSQPGVDDQFHGNAAEDVSLRPRLVLEGSPGEPPAVPVQLSRLVEADFSLPAYLNRDPATLVLRPSPSAQRSRSRGNLRPLAVEVSFEERDRGEVPRAPLKVTVNPGAEDTRVALDISGWPDGEYLTRIRESGGTGRYTGELLRMLRKQTIRPPQPPPEPADVAGLTLLMVDDWYLAERRGLRFRVHPARQYPIVEAPLAEGQVMARGLGLKVEDDGTLVAGFKTMDRRSANPRFYVARSRDAVDWEIVEEQRDAALPRAQVRSDSRPRLQSNLRPRLTWAAAEEPVAETYRFYDAERDGPVPLDQIQVKYTGYQPARWGELDLPARCTYPVWRKSSPAQSPGAQASVEYVLLTREPLTHDRWEYGGGRGATLGDLGEWNETNDNFGGQWLSADGKELRYCQGRTVPRFPPFRIEYDNLWSCNRILVVWSTRDGVSWTPTWFDTPTEDDPVGYQHYGARVFRAEGGNLLLAYLYVYQQASQQISLDVYSSRDGVYWRRYAGEPAFAPNGPPGAWNFGFIFPSAGPVEKDGRAYHLLGYCSNGPHFLHEFLYDRDDLSEVTGEWLRRRLEGRALKSWPFWEHYGSWEALAEAVRQTCQTVGIMVYRKDGWVSLSPEGERGSLVTRALRPGKTLSINARTEQGGSVRVEVLDAAGAPVPAYCGDNAAVFRGDDTGAALVWNGGKVTSLPDGPIRLRIALDRADLFALSWGAR